MSNGSGFHTTKDGTRIFFKDWGKGKPIVFSHGRPLDADAWDPQMLYLGLQGYRVIAHDRRAHGRSTQTWDGNDMNTYADDLSGLLDMLDVRDAILVGHSTGGGEVVRYLGRHGTKRVSKAVLIGAIPRVMLQSASNPGGLSIDVFDKIRAGVLQRSQFYKDLALPFYGYNRQGATPQQGVIDEFRLEGMRGGIKGQYDCVKQFSETDFTQDLQKIKIPTLILHGDDDQIVPISDSAALSSKLLSNATLKVYQGAPHGMCTTQADKVNADLLAFAKSRTWLQKRCTQEQSTIQSYHVDVRCYVSRGNNERVPPDGMLHLGHMREVTDDGRKFVYCATTIPVLIPKYHHMFVIEQHYER